MDVGVKQTLDTILEMYPQAKGPIPAGNEEAEWICHTAPLNIKDTAAITGNYHVVAGVGKGNWAEVPWISVFDRQVTTSALRGYYIVYLFRADMTGVYLSLNMGWTQFEDTFEPVGLARQRIEETASICRVLLRSSLGDFSHDPIRLASKNKLPRGYELGHIFGKLYLKGSLPEDEVLVDDLRNLIGVYRELKGYLGTRDITSLVTDYRKQIKEQAELEDSKYQQEVEEAEPEVVPPTPEPKPPHTDIVGYRKRKTRPGRAKASMEKAGYRCLVDQNHQTFISKVTGRNYVECHHFVPMEFQDEFPNNLDVEANIVSLCPNCHRLLHHAAATEKDEPLALLFDMRKPLLESSGIAISFSKLLQLYKAEDF